MKRPNSSTLVYSTEQGRHCRDCGQAVSACACSKAGSAASKTPVGDGIVRISRQTKGRKGSGVTVITGLPLQTAALAQLAKELKKRCASGGRVVDGVVEIQGEHQQAVQSVLQAHGFTVKLAGG